jgi:hypothetical protein
MMLPKLGSKQKSSNKSETMNLEKSKNKNEKIRWNIRTCQIHV